MFYIPFFELYFLLRPCRFRHGTIVFIDCCVPNRIDWLLCVIEFPVPSLFPCHHYLLNDASAGGGERSGMYFLQKVNQITSNPPAKAVRNILREENKQKQTNSGVTHPPVASVYSPVHPSATATDLGGIYDRKPINSPQILSTTAIKNIISTQQTQSRQNGSNTCHPVVTAWSLMHP